MFNALLQHDKPLGGFLTLKYLTFVVAAKDHKLTFPIAFLVSKCVTSGMI